MKVIAVSGSPRKNWNTEKMLASALDGAQSLGAKTKLIRLYDLNFKGCKSCLACKRIDARRKCFIKDDLSPVLEELSKADAIIFGSPIYFMELTGVMHSCLERFYFPYVTYSAQRQTFFVRKLPIGFIYTMNVTPDWLQQIPIANRFASVTKELFGVEPEIVCAYDTWQYPDYEKFEHGIFSVEQKKRHREEDFPKELEAARQLGITLAQKVKKIYGE